MNEFQWHNIAIKEISQLLKTNLTSGLRPTEVAEKQKKFGLNKLPEEKKQPWLFIFLSQFKSPMIYVLLLAALVSFVLGEYVDVIVILIAVFINTIIGFVQENKAEKTLAHLKKIISYKSTVLRDNKKMSLDSSLLVAGDILLLEAGDRVPADGRIFEVYDLQTNEASLTGESMPVSKRLGELERGTNLADRQNMVFMGTVVTRGRAKVIITSIASKTQLGEIAQLVKETTNEQTPLQEKLTQFSRWIGLTVLVSCLLIFFVGIILGYAILEMFTTAVAVAVAAIPEGLLVSVTIVLTVGMQRILRKKALVRRLVAAETLGSTSVICTDKTGTLTEGIMRVNDLLTGHCDLEKDLVKISAKVDIKEMVDHYKLLAIGTVCNNTIISQNESSQDEFIGDATEKALLKAAIDAGINFMDLQQKETRLDEIPFSTELKYMVTLNKLDEKNNIIYLKGAPERILDFCSDILLGGEQKNLVKEGSDRVQQNINLLTSQSLRVLAAAYKIVDKNKTEISEQDLSDFVFTGVFALKDPLRQEAKNTIALCKSAGITPVIITGDHHLTVKAVAQEIGLTVKEENILEGADLDKLSDEELHKIVKSIKVYARVSPKHKLRIVAAWQSHGEVVAMLGDGVNDAPALKIADIGVALGSGTDVAKETADIVLLDDNFKTIVSAIKQGRIIFDNIRKVITYLLSASFTEIILIVGALLARLPLPILALQILYVNIITDGFPGIALTFEPGEKDIMAEKPRKKQEPILNQEMKYLIFIISIISDLIFLVLFFYLWRIDYGIERIRTIVFTVLALGSLLYIFSIKVLRKNIWQINIFNNAYLLLAVLLGLFLQLFALYTPFMREVLDLVLLTPGEWLIIIALSVIKIVGIEIGKYFFIHKKKITPSIAKSN